MSQLVTITSMTANTPVDIYYCDSFSANCVFVSTVSVFPYEFNVPSPYDEEDFVIKIIDTQGCDVGDMVFITPTPTSSVTPTQTPTQTGTPTQTPTSSVTPTQTPTQTTTPTQTPTQTSTPTQTPFSALHYVGQNSYTMSSTTCNDAMTILPYYTYLSESSTTPVSGATVYETSVNGVLYNPFNGGRNYYKMVFGEYYYIVRIDTNGEIMSYEICSGLITPTPTPTTTQTQTPTNTPTQTTTQTQTPTNTSTNTLTPTNTPTNTETPTNTPTPTQTETPGFTPTNTPTNTSTPTNTPTNTSTPTPTPTSLPLTISQYGYLYNQYFAHQNNFAPPGWRMPEWYDSSGNLGDILILRNYTSDSGGGLKSIVTSPSPQPRWVSPNVGATNLYGFTALPAGFRLQNGNFWPVGYEFRLLGGGYDYTGLVPLQCFISISSNSTIASYSAGLTIQNVAYSVRFVKEDPNDWSPGDTVTDYEGNVYNTVKIGTQVWTLENWRSLKYFDGNDISLVQDSTAWVVLTTPAACYNTYGY